MIKIHWKRAKMGYNGYIAGILIFSIMWTPAQSRGAPELPEPYILRSTLPGLDAITISGKTEGDLMLVAYAELKKWLVKIGVEPCRLS